MSNSNSQPFFNTTNQTESGSTNLPLDQDWVRTSFLLSSDGLNDSNHTNSQLNTTNLGSLTQNPILYYRYWSSAYLKFTNTQLGGNIGVNPKPQFTRYADIRIPGLVHNNPVSIETKDGAGLINIGMGRYYSEAIDDKAQRVYFRFGVPMFNTLSNFLMNMFSTDLADLANTGRGPSIFYKAADIVSSVVSFVLFPFATTLLTTVSIIERAVTSKSISSFYTMKPTMPLYWSAVNDLVNELATYRGILPPGMLSNTHLTPMANNAGVTATDIATYHKLLPNVFTAEGALNVYAMANKTQMMYEAAHKSLKDIEKNQSMPSLTPGLYKSTVQSAVKKAAAACTPGTLADLITKYKNSSLGVNTATTTTKGSKAPGSTPTSTENLFLYDAKSIAKNSKDLYISATKAKPSFLNYFKSEAEAGGGFAVFIVDDTGSQSESFSNEVGESQVSSFINNITSQARAVKFDMADGSVIPGLGALTGAVGDTIKGAADGFHLGGLVNMLFGMGYVTVPKYWTGSSANLPRASYKFDLVSPYGNPISQLQNIYLPLAMLLCGALPLSTGKQSYTSPFICQLFDRGKVQIQLGIIDSIDITRGTTNLKYNQEWRMLGMEVSISVVDLSTIMHVPLSKGTFFNMLENVAATGISSAASSMLGQFAGKIANTAAGSLALAATDENAILYDYLMIVAGASAQDSLFFVSKARLQLANSIKYTSELTSPAFWANKMYGWANSAWGVSALTHLYAGFSVNAELATPAQAATGQYLNRAPNPVNQVF
jgi:hypothetical protein